MDDDNEGTKQPAVTIKFAAKSKKRKKAPRLTKRPQKTMKDTSKIPKRNRKKTPEGQDVAEAVTPSPQPRALSFAETSSSSSRPQRAAAAARLSLFEEDSDDDSDEELIERAIAEAANTAVKRETTTEGIRRRMATAYFFIDVLGAPTKEETQWDGNNGLVRKVATLVNGSPLPIRHDTRQIEAVMMDCVHHVKNGLSYDGSIKKRKQFENYLIKDKSVEMELIADFMEYGFGLRQTTAMVNLYREEEGKIDVGVSTVRAAFLRLKPIKTAIRKRPQGSFDTTSDWCRANFNWNAQLLIRLNHFPHELEAKLAKEADGRFVRYFDLSNLMKIDIYRCAYFDEVHKQVSIGRRGAIGRSEEYRVPRDDKGKVDPVNGKLRARGTKLHMKYTEEARIQYGVAMRSEGGRDVGYRLAAFEYTGKNMVTHRDFQSEFWKEVRRPKSLSGNSYPWVDKRREGKTIYKGDSCKKLKDVGNRAEQLFNEKGIKTVEDVWQKLEFNVEARQDIVKRCRGLSDEKLRAVIAEARSADEAPAAVDHRKADNPYLSRYGETDWKEKVLQSAPMKKVVNVRDVITHMITTCHDFYGDWNFVFYHDALSLMTAAETMDWMREKQWLKHWVLPDAGLNEGIGKYAGRPVGNNACLMPLDETLNKDGDDAVHRHVAATVMYDKEDPRKFSVTTPKQVASAYLRVWNNPPVLRDGVQICPSDQGWPPSDRIVHDILETRNYMIKVVRNDGMNQAINIPGARGDEARELKRGKWGGARIKGSGKQAALKWAHPDARDGLKMIVNKSKQRWVEDNVRVASNSMLQQCMDPDVELEEVVIEADEPYV